MKLNQLAASIALAAGVLASGSAFAAGPASAEYFPFSEIMSMKMMDKNKDGMVSKKEFMDMMSMAWEMNAKKMSVKGDKMTADQFKDMLTYMQGK